MSSISEIRALTGAIRPSGNHGCQPAELLPGLWAANYKDVDTTEKLAAVAPVSLVVNAGTDVCQTKTGSYGDGISVLRVEDLNDDPEARKKVREAANPNLPHPHSGVQRGSSEGIRGRYRLAVPLQ